DSLSPSSNPPPPSSADLSQRSALVSRSLDRRDRRDPAKAAALGLTQGPAVGGQESLSSQDPQAIAEALLPSYGWSTSQMSCLVPLWMGESGWRVTAQNVSSGAYGIPQALPGAKMATVGADWRTDPVTQIKWGLGYIQERYGSPCGAWGFKQGHGWY
ncbi:MAG: lytic transglycosylase domain-containing protein, partial [Nocardioides sp.]